MLGKLAIAVAILVGIVYGLKSVYIPLNIKILYAAGVIATFPLSSEYLIEALPDGAV